MEKVKAYAQTQRAQKAGLLEQRFLEAADQSNIDEIVRCIAAGVNPNCVDKQDRCTALHIAAERGDIPLTAKLLKCKNINLHAISLHGYMALHIACLFNKFTMVRCLLKAGINVNAPDRLERTALHLAAFGCKMSMVKLLLKFGAHVDVVDAMGRTPLYISLLEAPYLPIATIFLKSGGSLETYIGNMPLFIECVLTCHTEEQIEIVKFLIKNGANVNVVDKLSKRNALHYLALSSYLPLLPVLLKAGINVDYKDTMKKRPIDIATDHCNWEFVCALPVLENPSPDTTSS